MEKTISIKRADFIRNVLGVVNGSGLPACVISDCLHIIVNDIDAIARQQLEKDIAEYRRAIEEEEQNEPEPEVVTE